MTPPPSFQHKYNIPEISVDVFYKIHCISNASFNKCPYTVYLKYEIHQQGLAIVKCNKCFQRAYSKVCFRQGLCVFCLFGKDSGPLSMSLTPPNPFPYDVLLNEEITSHPWMHQLCTKFCKRLYLNRK